jgi:phytoene/squalene synthetase
MKRDGSSRILWRFESAENGRGIRARLDNDRVNSLPSELVAIGFGEGFQFIRCLRVAARDVAHRREHKIFLPRQRLRRQTPDS